MMKSLTILYAVLIAGAGCSTVKHASMKKNNPVVAHRGAWKAKAFPENSIASLKEAIALGCTGSEFDVRMTADDSLVINHDPAYKGLQIEKTTYASLVAHKLSNGEKLPTLREYIIAGMENNPATTLVVEIKPSDIGREKAEASAVKTVELVRLLGAEKKVQYISFDYNILQKIRQVDKSAVLQYLNGDKSPEELKAGNVDGADYHFSVFQKHPEWVESAKKYRLILNAWTVNAEADINWLIKNKFDFITTNEPGLALNLYKQY